MPARFIFHAVTSGYVTDLQPEAQSGGIRQLLALVVPSRDLISELMESCFYQADTLNVRSIALPLLGTGTMRFDRDVCLDTMFRFLARKFLHGLTTVREARIVLFPPRRSGGG